MYGVTSGQLVSTKCGSGLRRERFKLASKPQGGAFVTQRLFEPNSFAYRRLSHWLAEQHPNWPWLKVDVETTAVSFGWKPDPRDANLEQEAGQ